MHLHAARRGSWKCLSRGRKLWVAVLLRFLTSLCLAVHLLLSLLLASGCCEASWERPWETSLCCRVCLTGNSHRMRTVLFLELMCLKDLLWPSLLTCFVAQPVGALQNFLKYSWLRRATLLHYLISVWCQHGVGVWWEIICAVKKGCSFLVFMCVFPVGGVSETKRGKCDSPCCCVSLYWAILHWDYRTLWAQGKIDSSCLAVC